MIKYGFSEEDKKCVVHWKFGKSYKWEEMPLAWFARKETLVKCVWQGFRNAEQAPYVDVMKLIADTHFLRDLAIKLKEYGFKNFRA